MQLEEGCRGHLLKNRVSSWKLRKARKSILPSEPLEGINSTNILTLGQWHWFQVLSTSSGSEYVYVVLWNQLCVNLFLQHHENDADALSKFFLLLSSSSSSTSCGNLLYNSFQFSSVQFSRSVMSDSLQPHGPKHARLPWPSPTPGVYPNSCPLTRWYHPTISLSVVPFSSLLQYLPASGSFPMSRLFASGGQSTGASVSASVLPMNTQDWSPLGWTGWTSLKSKGLSRVFSNTTVQKHRFFGAQLPL